MQERPQRLKVGNDKIEANVELPAVYQKWISDVALCYVLLLLELRNVL